MKMKKARFFEGEGHLKTVSIQIESYERLKLEQLVYTHTHTHTKKKKIKYYIVLGLDVLGK